MSAAQNVLSMRKIFHRANQIKNIKVNKELKKYKPSKRGVSDLEKHFHFNDRTFYLKQSVLHYVGRKRAGSHQEFRQYFKQVCRYIDQLSHIVKNTMYRETVTVQQQFISYKINLTFYVNKIISNKHIYVHKLIHACISLQFYNLAFVHILSVNID